MIGCSLTIAYGTVEGAHCHNLVVVGSIIKIKNKIKKKGLVEKYPSLCAISSHKGI